MFRGSSISGYPSNTRAEVLFAPAGFIRGLLILNTLKTKAVLFLMIIFPGAELDFFPAGWMPGVGIILTGVPAAQGISQPVPDNPTGGFGPEAAPQGQDLLSACQSWSCSCHHFLGKPKEREGKLKQKQQKYPTQLRGQELLVSV